VKMQFSEGTFAFNMLGGILTIYHNALKKDTFGHDSAVINSIEIFKDDKLISRFEGNIIKAPYAKAVRSGEIDRVEIYFK